jgi:hypothetical protein
VPAGDPCERLAGLIERQYRLDLGVEVTRIDEAAECLQPGAVHVGGERLASDATLENEQARGFAAR